MTGAIHRAGFLCVVVFSALLIVSDIAYAQSGTPNCEQRYYSCLNAKVSESSCTAQWEGCMQKCMVAAGSLCNKDPECQLHCTENGFSTKPRGACCEPLIGPPPRRNTCPQRIDNQCMSNAAKPGDWQGEGDTQQPQAQQPPSEPIEPLPDTPLTDSEIIEKTFQDVCPGCSTDPNAAPPLSPEMQQYADQAYKDLLRMSDYFGQDPSQIPGEIANNETFQLLDKGFQNFANSFRPLDLGYPSDIIPRFADPNFNPPALQNFVGAFGPSTFGATMPPIQPFSYASMLPSMETLRGIGSNIADWLSPGETPAVPGPSTMEGLADSFGPVTGDAPNASQALQDIASFSSPDPLTPALLQNQGPFDVSTNALDGISPGTVNASNELAAIAGYNVPDGISVAQGPFDISAPAASSESLGSLLGSDSPSAGLTFEGLQASGQTDAFGQPYTIDYSTNARGVVVTANIPFEQYPDGVTVYSANGYDPTDLSALGDAVEISPLPPPEFRSVIVDMAGKTPEQAMAEAKQALGLGPQDKVIYATYGDKGLFKPAAEFVAFDGGKPFTPATDSGLNLKEGYYGLVGEGSYSDAIRTVTDNPTGANPFAERILGASNPFTETKFGHEVAEFVDAQKAEQGVFGRAWEATKSAFFGEPPSTTVAGSLLSPTEAFYANNQVTPIDIVDQVPTLSTETPQPSLSYEPYISPETPPQAQSVNAPSQPYISPEVPPQAESQPSPSPSPSQQPSPAPVASQQPGAQPAPVDGGSQGQGQQPTVPGVGQSPVPKQNLLQATLDLLRQFNPIPSAWSSAPSRQGAATPQVQQPAAPRQPVNFPQQFNIPVNDVIPSAPTANRIPTEASVYGYAKDPTAGSKITASGASRDNDKFSVAHNSLPIGFVLEITSVENGVVRMAVAPVNNRGPFKQTASGAHVPHPTRGLDMTPALAKALGLSGDASGKGVAKVTYRVIAKPASTVPRYNGPTTQNPRKLPRTDYVAGLTPQQSEQIIAALRNSSPTQYADIPSQQTVAGRIGESISNAIQNSPIGKAGKAIGDGITNLVERSLGALVGGGNLPPRGTPIRGAEIKVSNIVQDACAAIGGGCKATSGYRSEEQNRAAGGAEKSRHLDGDAVDVKVPTEKALEFAKAVNTALCQRNSCDGGVGYYRSDPKTGLSSFHVDTRRGEQKVWGPTHSRASLPNNAIGRTVGARRAVDPVLGPTLAGLNGGSTVAEEQPRSRRMTSEMAKPVAKAARTVAQAVRGTPTRSASTDYRHSIAKSPVGGVRTEVFIPKDADLNAPDAGVVVYFAGMDAGSIRTFEQKFQQVKEQFAGQNVAVIMPDLGSVPSRSSSRFAANGGELGKDMLANSYKVIQEATGVAMADKRLSAVMYSGGTSPGVAFLKSGAASAQTNKAGSGLEVYGGAAYGGFEGFVNEWAQQNPQAYVFGASFNEPDNVPAANAAVARSFGQPVRSSVPDGAITAGSKTFVAMPNRSHNASPGSGIIKDVRQQAKAISGSATVVAQNTTPPLPEQKPIITTAQGPIISGEGSMQEASPPAVTPAPSAPAAPITTTAQGPVVSAEGSLQEPSPPGVVQQPAAPAPAPQAQPIELVSTETIMEEQRIPISPQAVAAVNELRGAAGKLTTATNDLTKAFSGMRSIPENDATRIEKGQAGIRSAMGDVATARRELQAAYQKVRKTNALSPADVKAINTGLEAIEQGSKDVEAYRPWISWITPDRVKSAWPETSQAMAKGMATVRSLTDRIARAPVVERTIQVARQVTRPLNHTMTQQASIAPTLAAAPSEQPSAPAPSITTTAQGSQISPETPPQAQPQGNPRGTQEGTATAAPPPPSTLRESFNNFLQALLDINQPDAGSLGQGDGAPQGSGTGSGVGNGQGAGTQAPAQGTGGTGTAPAPQPAPAQASSQGTQPTTPPPAPAAEQGSNQENPATSPAQPESRLGLFARSAEGIREAFGRAYESFRSESAPDGGTPGGSGPSQSQPQPPVQVPAAQNPNPPQAPTQQPQAPATPPLPERKPNPPAAEPPPTRTRTEVARDTAARSFGTGAGLGSMNGLGLLGALGQIMQGLGNMYGGYQGQQPMSPYYPSPTPIGPVQPQPTQPTQPATTTPAKPLPSVSVTASPNAITSGATSTLRWISFRSTGCELRAGGSLITSSGTQGERVTDTLFQTTSFVVSCIGDGGIRSATTTVYVDEQPPQAAQTQLSAPAPTYAPTAGTGGAAPYSPPQGTGSNPGAICDPMRPANEFVACLGAQPGGINYAY